MAITAEMRTQVLELYTAYFNRAADKAGVDYWTNEMDTNGWTLDQVAQSFADQTEYTTAYAGMDNAAIVTAVYTNVLNRDADTDGSAYWVAELDAGTMSVENLIQAVVTAAKEDKDGLGDADVLANKVAVSEYAYEKALDEAAAKAISLDAITADASSVATVSALIDITIETAAVAAYDTALVAYNAAVAAYDASKAAADTAALTVSSVTLATAAKTAAETAKTDADTLAAAADTLAAAAANTPTVLDDASSATAVTDAATAVAAAATLVDTTTTALATVIAAEEAAAAVGTTFSLTTGTDTIFGTDKSDTINATAGAAAADKTFNANDTIVDSSSIDNDTITITATDDVTATGTIIGIENVNFNLNAASTPAGTDTVFDINAANIAAGTLTAAVTKAATTVTATSITNLKDDMVVATDLATATLAGVANADLTLNMTATTATTVAAVTGTTDDLTINAAGNVTITDADAEENIVINGEGSVTITDLTAATVTSASTLTVNAKGAVAIADDSNASTGAVNVTTTTGNIVIGGTAWAQTGDINLTTANGDVTVTNADTSTKTITISATGDGVAATTGADGDVTVTSAGAATAMVITATGAIVTAANDNVETLTLTAGQDSTLDGVLDVETLTLASAVSADPVSGNAVKYTAATTQNELNRIDNIIFTGSNDVTLAIDGTDIVAAAADTTHSAAAAIIATDNSTATSRIEIQEATGATADLSKLAVDVIAFTVDMSNHALTVASGATIDLDADQTNVNLTAAAVAGNTVNLIIEDDNVAADANSWDMTSIVTTNIATVNLALNDTEEAILGTTINVGTTNDMVVTGAGDFTIGTSVTAKTFDASAATGIFDIQLVNTIDTIIKTGSGNDIFTTDGTANDYNIDGGAGVDTLEVAKNEDYSAVVGLTLTNIEKIDVSGSDNAGDMVFAGSQMTGKDYVIFGDNAADNVSITAQITTGETIDLSGISTSLVITTLTGAAGGDILTGSATSATTIAGLAGADTIVGGAAVDTITGGAGADTITAGEGADIIDGGAGADTINLAETTAAADTVSFTAPDALNATANADTINDFKTTSDKLSFDGITITGGGAIAATAGTAVTSGSHAAAALTDDKINVISDGATALTSAGTETISSYTDLDDVAAYLNEGYTSTADDDAAVFVINDLVADKTYVYLFDEKTNGASTIQAADLALIGIVNEVADAALVAGDIA